MYFTNSTMPKNDPVVIPPSSVTAPTAMPILTATPSPRMDVSQCAKPVFGTARALEGILLTASEGTEAGTRPGPHPLPPASNLLTSLGRLHLSERIFILRPISSFTPLAPRRGGLRRFAACRRRPACLNGTPSPALRVSCPAGEGCVFPPGDFTSSPEIFLPSTPLTRGR